MMEGWVWGVVGATAGTLLGVAGGYIGVLSSRRVAGGEESFLRMRKWNVYDGLYTSLVVVGLLFLLGSVVSIWFEMLTDAYALSLLSLVFLFSGCLNAIIRVRALQA